MRRYWLFLGWLLLVPAFGFGQQANLSGKVCLDTGWTRRFYVCRMPGFDYMFTTYSALIIAEGGIDTAGNFSINFPATNDESLYRLHFIRNGDPAATLIIGSREVNHVFFIAKQNDHIDFKKGVGQPIRQSGINGSKSNDELNALLELSDEDATGNSALISIATKSTSQLVALLAISRTDGLNNEQKEKVHDILARYDHHNAYGTHIFQEYRDLNYWKLYLAVVILLIVALSVYGYHFYKRRTILKIWRELSQREMDIVGLILSGKSNKEVAMALSIELSTVKTHVNNIYAKLEVSSRRDLDRYKGLVNNAPVPSVT